VRNVAIYKSHAAKRFIEIEYHEYLQPQKLSTSVNKKKKWFIGNSVTTATIASALPLAARRRAAFATVLA